MIRVDEALAAVLERAKALPARAVPLHEALGLTLDEDIAADLDLPPFNKALVDGYAIRSVELTGVGCRFVVGEEIPAGRTPTRPLARGEAALVMTGAPLPEGTDAVVMIERTRRDGLTVLMDEGEIPPGRNLMPRATEMRVGDVVLTKGMRLNPPRLGLAASVGRTSLQIIPRPRVAILTTGDELVEPGIKPGPGQIRNSNATMLAALAEQSGATVDLLPTAPDAIGLLTEALQRGLSADILLIAGGVSAGNRDLVPSALSASGAEQIFHKVRMKPGKPLWFGVGPARGEAPGSLVFGLPGNPVSGLVGFLLFVRPAIAVSSGRDGSVPTWRARLAAPCTITGENPTYFPARLQDDSARQALPSLTPLDWAGSADLRTIASADGFAIFPVGARVYSQGEIVEFLPLR